MAQDLDPSWGFLCMDVYLGRCSGKLACAGLVARGSGQSTPQLLHITEIMAVVVRPFDRTARGTNWGCGVALR